MARREFKLWLTAKRKLRASVAALLKSVDLVVVNVEGTMHHNRPGALALLAIIDLAVDDHLPVVLLNGTFQAMDTSLLTKVLSRCGTILARDPLSVDYLINLGISARLAPDCLFTLADFNGPPNGTRITGRACLYTPGVLSETAQLSESIVRSQLNDLIDAGYSVSFLEVEREDRRFWDTAQSLNVNWIGLSDIPWFAMVDYLRQYSLIVSGRYHMLIYAWIAGVRAIPMPSNTWKIAGVLKLVGSDVKPVSHNLPLADALQIGTCPDQSVLHQIANLSRSETAAALERIKTLHRIEPLRRDSALHSSLIKRMARFAGLSGN